MSYSFDEFKMIFDSAEKVTDRRDSWNRWSYSVCAAISVALAFIGRWSFEPNNNGIAGEAALVVLSALALVYTYYWIDKITGYKKLNDAKFKVLGEMSLLLHFEEGVESYQPLKKEWDFVQQSDALESDRRSGITGLKSTANEFFLPRAFRVIFGLVLLTSLTLLLVEVWKAFF